MTRIIAGVAGSLRLEVPKSGTRPTSDRVREAIFSTLTSWGLVRGVQVLDLYAGSGALGLEAASRGAREVTLVERHAASAAVTSRNAALVTRAFRDADAPRIAVVRQAVQTFLGSATADAEWDVVLLDPPYDLPESDLAGNLNDVVAHVSPDGVVMVERSARSPEPTWPAGLGRFDHRRYGETTLWWAERRDEE